jgi:hypothetical protein
VTALKYWTSDQSTAVARAEWTCTKGRKSHCTRRIGHQLLTDWTETTEIDTMAAEQVVAAHQAVMFRMSDDRFDGIAAFERATQRSGDAALG